jgi:hypothetical protein
VAGLSAATCGLCHLPQYNAWRESLHARALSPGVLGQLDAFDGPTLSDCLSCHSPREEMLDRWQDQGLDGAADMAGVDCIACHVRGHVRHGPRAIAETPHGAVVPLPLYRQAAFCAPCHQFDEGRLTVNGKPLENTYVEWSESRYAREGVTCQACHMPNKQHAFRGIHDRNMTRQGLAVAVTRHAAGIRVKAGNTGAGHALPTYVTPRILIDIAGDTGARALRHVIARQMRWSMEHGWEEISDTRLFPDQWITLELDLTAECGGQVSVRVEPGYDYHERVYPFLLGHWGEGISLRQRALLHAAREQAGGTAYSLYRFDCPPWRDREEPCLEHP